MTKEHVRSRIAEIGIIPAIRLSSAKDALFAAEAVSSGGIPIVEVTMTVPGAIEVITELAKNSPNLAVGGGTIPDVDTAGRCLDAGATFLTTPGLDLKIVEFALKKNVVVFPGAMTPTEILTASKAGADFVKVFPCSALGGANYIKALKAPFPKIPLIASGGVKQQNAVDLIRAGAVALGIGKDLIAPAAISRHERGWIVELSGRYIEMVKYGRNPE